MLKRRRKTVEAPDALDLALSTLALVPVPTWEPQPLAPLPVRPQLNLVTIHRNGRLIGATTAENAPYFPGYVIS